MASRGVHAFLHPFKIEKGVPQCHPFALRRYPLRPFPNDAMKIVGERLQHGHIDLVSFQISTVASTSDVKALQHPLPDQAAWRNSKLGGKLAESLHSIHRNPHRVDLTRFGSHLTRAVDFPSFVLVPSALLRSFLLRGDPQEFLIQRLRHQSSSAFCLRYRDRSALFASIAVVILHLPCGGCSRGITNTFSTLPTSPGREGADEAR